MTEAKLTTLSFFLNAGSGCSWRPVWIHKILDLFDPVPSDHTPKTYPLDGPGWSVQGKNSSDLLSLQFESRVHLKTHIRKSFPPRRGKYRSGLDYFIIPALSIYAEGYEYTDRKHKGERVREGEGRDRRHLYIGEADVVLGSELISNEMWF